MLAAEGVNMVGMDEPGVVGAERIAGLGVAWWGEGRIDTVLRYSRDSWRAIRDGGGFGSWFAVTEPNVAGNHTYADDGTYTATVRYADQERQDVEDVVNDLQGVDTQRGHSARRQCRGLARHLTPSWPTVSPSPATPIERRKEPRKNTNSHGSTGVRV